MTHTPEMLDWMGGLVAGVIGGNYSRTDPLPNNVPGVFLGQVPHDFPMGIAMMPYQVDEDPTLISSVGAIQLLYRGTFDAVMEYRDAVFQVLQGNSFRVSPTLAIELVQRNSSISLGFDASARLSWSDNYYLQFWSPETSRL